MPPNHSTAPWIIPHRDYAYLSYCVYNPDSPLPHSCAALTVDERLSVPGRWDIYLRSDVGPAPLTAQGFFAVAYYSDTLRAVVIAIRGTSTDPANLGVIAGNLRADLDIFLDKYPKPIYADAVTFYQRVVAKLAADPSREDYVLSLTGHSLGAFLAQLVAWEYYCVAVTFECPGAFEAAYTLWKEKYQIHGRQQPSGSLKQPMACCYNYLGDFNIVNMCSNQIGTNFILQDITYPAIGGALRFFEDFIIALIAGGTLEVLEWLTIHYPTFVGVLTPGVLPNLKLAVESIRDKAKSRNKIRIANVVSFLKSFFNFGAHSMKGLLDKFIEHDGLPPLKQALEIPSQIKDYVLWKNFILEPKKEVFFKTVDLDQVKFSLFPYPTTIDTSVGHIHHFYRFKVPYLIAQGVALDPQLTTIMVHYRMQDECLIKVSPDRVNIIEIQQTLIETCLKWQSEIDRLLACYGVSVKKGEILAENPHTHEVNYLVEVPGEKNNWLVSSDGVTTLKIWAIQYGPFMKLTLELRHTFSVNEMLRPYAHLPASYRSPVSLRRVQEFVIPNCLDRIILACGVGVNHVHPCVFLNVATGVIEWGHPSTFYISKTFCKGMALSNGNIISLSPILGVVHGCFPSLNIWDISQLPKITPVRTLNLPSISSMAKFMLFFQYVGMINDYFVYTVHPAHVTHNIYIYKIGIGMEDKSLPCIDLSHESQLIADFLDLSDSYSDSICFASSHCDQKIRIWKINEGSVQLIKTFSIKLMADLIMRASRNEILCISSCEPHGFLTCNFETGEICVYKLPFSIAMHHTSLCATLLAEGYFAIKFPLGFAVYKAGEVKPLLVQSMPYPAQQSACYAVLGLSTGGMLVGGRSISYLPVN